MMILGNTIEGYRIRGVDSHVSRHTERGVRIERRKYYMQVQKVYTDLQNIFSLSGETDGTENQMSQGESINGVKTQCPKRQNVLVQAIKPIGTQMHVAAGHRNGLHAEPRSESPQSSPPDYIPPLRSTSSPRPRPAGRRDRSPPPSANCSVSSTQRTPPAINPHTPPQIHPPGLSGRKPTPETLPPTCAPR